MGKNAQRRRQKDKINTEAVPELGQRGHSTLVDLSDTLRREWLKLEAEREARKTETSKWSEARLGQGLELFRSSVLHAETVLQSIDNAVRREPDNAGARQFQAVQLQLEFALGRLLNANELILNGFLFDGGGILRVAWESISRAFVFLLSQEDALSYLNGSVFGQRDIKKKLGTLSPNVSREFETSFNTLSQYSHSYSVQALHLQMEPQGSRDEGILMVTQNGVHRERDLLLLYAECVHFTHWIPWMMLPFEKQLQWEPIFLKS